MNIENARKKAKEIVSQMTVDEKISQLVYNAPAVERLGINEYNWWNEAAHGVARAGVATVFPQAIGMAASFNPELVKTVADAVSTEARAKYNKSVQFRDYDIYKGLTFWTPNINIFRDPRWGRGQETFGEDPFLTAMMGVSYIKGLQGDGEFLKSAACAKHFAVHSGPERLRHSFDAKCSMKDLWETYLPAFEHAVASGVVGVMGAYNRTNGEPCCAHSYLMETVLQKLWKFDGYFVSDCGAINDISENHHYTDNIKDAAALALKKGCNLNCGEAYMALTDAYEEDMITEEDITDAVIKLFTIRAMLGEFEETNPYADVSYDMLDCDEHKELNLKIARESLVLLKNANKFLPLNSEKCKRIAVVGPNSNSCLALEGNYCGIPSEHITIAEGIRRSFTDSRVIVAKGSRLYRETKNCWGDSQYLLSEGLAAASEADVTVLCLGMDRSVEGEEIEDLFDECFDKGDRYTVRLPKTQIKLAESVCDICENVIVIVNCGCAVDLGEKVNEKAKAIIHGWYPGGLGGLAIAQLLKGDYSPGGKLPLTFYRAETKLSELTDYSMDGKTYRFLDEMPLFPFGFGLSYTQFEYKSAEVISVDEKKIGLRVTVTNTGDMDASEKVQIYAKYEDSRTKTPQFQLCAVSPVFIASGKTATIDINIDRYWIKAVLEDGTRTEPDGKIILYAGGHQPDKRSFELCGNECLTIDLKTEF